MSRDLCPKCLQIGMEVEAVHDQTGWRCPQCNYLATSRANALAHTNDEPNPGLLFDRIDARLWDGCPVDGDDWSIIAGRFFAWDGNAEAFIDRFIAEATAPEIEGRTRLELTGDDFRRGLAVAGLRIVEVCAWSR